ncbi:MAG TPA: hypothetical protein VIC57_16665 [Candidatus Dormibacteraeota bacterium]|jgi:hypothetical protein
MAIEDWDRVLDRASERVTIRIPRIFKEQMDVRARTAGRSINEEYGRAVEAWCGGGEGWTRILLRAESIRGDVRKETVERQQLGAVLVDELEMEGRYIGLRVAGYAITLDRGWFVSDETFEEVRGFLASQLPLLAQIGPAWGPQGGSQEPTIFTYGAVGQPCRKVGCKAASAQSVTVTHVASGGKRTTIDIPLCPTHALETLATIASGDAPKFTLS